METTSAAGTVVGLGLGVLVIYLLYLVIGGLIVGALARLALPGPDPMSWFATLGYGVAGSFLGGIVGRLVGIPGSFGLLLGVACAAGLIWYFKRRGRPTAAIPTPPSSPPPPSVPG